MFSRPSRTWFITFIAALVMGWPSGAFSKAPRKTTSAKVVKKKKKRAASKRRAKRRRAARLRRAARVRRAAKRRKTARARRLRVAKKATATAKQSRIQAVRLATDRGRKILQTAQAMIDEGRIVKGSCWDWVQAVFNRAGFPNKRGFRRTAFKGSRKSGPFAKPAQLQPGDWIYHVNHQYRGVPHSAIFVRWVDRSRNMAETLSYAGSRRNKPGRYGIYDLSNVYRIIRPAKRLAGSQ